jgi:hypothetical protein
LLNVDVSICSAASVTQQQRRAPQPLELEYFQATTIGAARPELPLDTDARAKADQNLRGFVAASCRFVRADL